MSRSAGRVLIIPRGEYSATTQYYMLDLVEYNGCGYVAKQATKGNLPTDQNYWQQMGTTGGGGGGNYMFIDGSNAEILKFSENQTHTIDHVDITKAEGENQTVYMTVNVKYNSTKGKLTTLIRNELSAHIGDENVIFYEPVMGGNPIEHHVVIDSVGGASTSYNTNDDSFTVQGHLLTDTTSVIGLTDTSLTLGEYISDEVDRGISFGYGQTLSNNLSFAGGRQGSAGIYSEAFGDRCVAGSYSHAEGQETCAVNRGHAEGKYTAANGEASHAEGTGTITVYSNQHAMGKWNMPRYDAILMVGGGTPDDRSNIFEIYEDGSISFDNGTTKFKFAKVNNVWGFYDKNGTFYPFYPVTVATKTVTLSTSDITEIRISNNAIKANSRLDWFIDVYGINPTNVDAGVGYCDMTFPKVDTATTINIQLEIK